MSKFGLLLDSGTIIPLGSNVKTREQARLNLAGWRSTRRDQLAAGSMVSLRRPLGLVCFKHRESNPAAQQIGSIGGKARAAALSPERRSEIAKRAAETRWRGSSAT